MARPNKQGIDYFPLDVDLDCDDKLSMIIGEFGYKGEVIFLKLLGWIYKHDGYYTEWNEMEQLKFAKRVAYIGNPSVSLINEIVARCIKWGLFEQSVFDSLHILTSVRIQLTWTDATRKRKERQINPKIWLIGVNDGLKAEETQKKAAITNKRKESKVKEKSKSHSGATAPTEKRGFIKPSIEEVKDFFFSMIGNTKNQNCWPQDRCDNGASSFFDHYTANGWVQGRGKPIRDWQAACRNWIRNSLKGTFEKTFQKKDGEHIEQKRVLAISKPQLGKVQLEVNYLYDRYLEDKCTIITIEAVHYDQMKHDGLMKFTPSQTDKIKSLAIGYNASTEKDESLLLRLMKCYAVLEYFREQKDQQKEMIYVEPK